MTGAWKIEIVRVRLARLPENAEESSHLQLFLRVVLGECELRVPIELPDGKGTYFPPKAPPTISGDRIYKTPGNLLLSGLFMPMKGTKDLFRFQLMNRRDDRLSELGAFTVDVSDALGSAYFSPQGCVEEYQFRSAWPSADGSSAAVVGSCVIRLKYTLQSSMALSFKEKPTYVLDDRPARRLAEDEDTLPMFSGIPQAPRERASYGGPIPMARAGGAAGGPLSPPPRTQ